MNASPEAPQQHAPWDVPRLITLETALLAQQKGFKSAQALDVFVPDDKDPLRWQEARLTWDLNPGSFHDSRPNRLLRPTQDMLENWLRCQGLFLRVSPPYHDVPWQASVFPKNAYSSHANVEKADS